MTDFIARYKILLLNFSSRSIGIITFIKTFSKFYHRHFELVSVFKLRLKPLLEPGLSELEFYGDMTYKFNKNCK